MLAGIEESIEH